jgi:hypothetical protein
MSFFTGWLCGIGIHNWVQWSKPVRVNETAVQYRYCQRCNKHQRYSFADPELRQL